MRGALIDTNVFVYAFDPADPEKHQVAIQLIEDVGSVSATGSLFGML